MVGLAYLDAKYKNMGKGNEYKNGVRESGQGAWSASAALEYKADDSFSVIGRATYTGTTPFYTVNYNSSTVTKDSKHLEAPAYMVYDLGVTYNTKLNSVPVKFSAMCYNLFDRIIGLLLAVIRFTCLLREHSSYLPNLVCNKIKFKEGGFSALFYSI
jgi:iron complex outermembrane receptor protein